MRPWGRVRSLGCPFQAGRLALTVRCALGDLPRVFVYYTGGSGTWQAFCGRNLTDALQNQAGAIGEVADLLPAGDAGEDEDGVQAALDAGDDICVHPVTDDSGVLGMTAQNVQACPHHQGIWLADVIGGLARGQLDGGDQGAAGGDQALLRGAGQVAVGANEPGTVLDEAHGPADVLIGVTQGLAHDDIVRGHIVKGDALLIQGVEQARLPDDEGSGPGHLVGNEFGGGQGAGVKMLFIDVQAHAGELGLQFPLGLAAVVGEEEEFLVFLLEPGDKFLHAG